VRVVEGEVVEEKGILEGLLLEARGVSGDSELSFRVKGREGVLLDFKRSLAEFQGKELQLLIEEMSQMKLETPLGFENPAALKRNSLEHFSTESSHTFCILSHHIPFRLPLSLPSLKVFTSSLHIRSSHEICGRFSTVDLHKTPPNDAG
jgi:hypothetical protein